MRFYLFVHLYIKAVGHFVVLQKKVNSDYDKYTLFHEKKMLRSEVIYELVVQRKLAKYLMNFQNICAPISMYVVKNPLAFFPKVYENR